MSTSTTRVNRSWLIASPENEKFMHKLAESQADAVILELEAGTFNKEAARVQAVSALNNIDFGDRHRVVRVNPMSSSFVEDDLAAVVPAAPDAIMVAKVDSVEDVERADEIIRTHEQAHGLLEGGIALVAMIETARGVAFVNQIAFSSDRLSALLFGPGDYLADVRGLQTTGTGYPSPPGNELLMARTAVVVAARAAGISPVDGPSLVSVRDTSSLRTYGWQARALGFDGMGAVSPRQVPVINEVFTPLAHEVQRAEQALSAYNSARSAGAGVTGTADGEMVSETIAAYYEDTLRRANR